jgi:hypothetical protein
MVCGYEYVGICVFPVFFLCDLQEVFFTGAKRGKKVKSSIDIAEIYSIFVISFSF